MARDWLSLSQKDVAILAWLLAALGVVRLVGMFTVPFTDTTEARYAEIARKMVETGNWITPQFDYGVPFWGKPPLHTWLSAAGMELFGVNEFGARSLIFVCTLGVIWLVFRWLRDEIGAGAALASVTLLSSSVLFYGSAAFVMTDMAMTLGIVMVMTGFWRAINGQTTAYRDGLLVFVGLAIGLLAKGPVAVVLCGIPLFLWAIGSRRWREFIRLPWGQGIALMLALALPWYVVAELQTPGFLQYFIVGEHFERFTVPHWQGDLYGVGHERAKGMIWVGWIVAFLPWSLAVIPILFQRKNVVMGFAGDRAGWRHYLLCWVLSPMILFTMSANILAAYTLPAMPASAALLVVLYVDGWGRSQPKINRAGFLAMTSFTIILGAIFAVKAQIAPDSMRLRSSKELVAAVTEASGVATPLYYLDRRSYSGEFYTRGRAGVLADLESAESLAERPFALAVHQITDASLAPVLEQNYQRIGSYGRHVLYLRQGPSE